MNNIRTYQDFVNGHSDYKRKDKYINFPVELLEGFLVDNKECINNILGFGFYQYKSSKSDGSYRDAYKAFNTTEIPNLDILVNNRGYDIFETYRNKSFVSVGAKVEVLREFLEKEKTQKEKLFYLAFLAVKSILQSSVYQPISKKQILSRMAGFPDNVENEDLPKEIKKYSSDHHFISIREELRFAWNIKSYRTKQGKIHRCYYFSIKLSLEKLIRAVEANSRRQRKANKLKKDKELIKELRRQSK